MMETIQPNKYEPILNALRHDWQLLDHLPQRYTEIPEICLAAVKESPFAAQYFGKNLLKNRTFVLNMLEVDESLQSFKYINGTLKFDRTFLIEMISRYPDLIDKYLLPRSAYEDEVIYKAIFITRPVTAYTKARFIPRSYRNTYQRIAMELTSIKDFAAAYCDLPFKFQFDRHIATEFVLMDPYNCASLHKALRGDYSFAMAMMQELDLDLFPLLCYNLQNNQDIVEVAMAMNPNNIRYLGETLLEDRKWAFEAVKSGWFQWNQIPQEFVDDKEFVKDVLKNTEGCVSIPEQYKHDFEMLKCSKNFHGVEITEELLDDDFLKHVAKTDPWILHNTDFNLMDRRELVIIAIETDPDTLWVISKDWYADEEVNQILEANIEDYRVSISECEGTFPFIDEGVLQFYPDLLPKSNIKKKSKELIRRFLMDENAFWDELDAESFRYSDVLYEAILEYPSKAGQIPMEFIPDSWKNDQAMSIIIGSFDDERYYWISEKYKKEPTVLLELLQSHEHSHEVKDEIRTNLAYALIERTKHYSYEK